MIASLIIGAILGSILTASALVCCKAAGHADDDAERMARKEEHNYGLEK